MAHELVAEQITPAETAPVADATGSPEELLKLKNRSEDYHKINAIAHRKWTHGFLPPALTWHRAFWIRDIHERRPDSCPKDDNDRIAWEKNAKDYVKYKIDEVIVEFYRSVRDANLSPRLHPCINQRLILFHRVVDANSLQNVPIDKLTKRERDLYEDDGRVVTLHFTLHQMAMTVRIELRTEYFCVSTFAKFSENAADPNHWSKIEYDGFADKYRSLREQYALHDKEDVTATDRAKCALLNQYFHVEFWNQFIFDPCVKPSTLSVFKNHIFKNVFADFRGLIVSNETCERDMDDLEAPEKLDWGYKFSRFTRRMLSRTEKYECTAGYLLDGRILHMSTLAPQDPSRPDEEIIPLEYVLFVQKSLAKDRFAKGVNLWQLGRVVDRLHTLGTVRIAALKYFSSLIEVGAALGRFDPFVETAREEIRKYSDVFENKITELCDKAHVEFNRITENFNAGTNTTSGIMYRIDRSNYYSNQFLKNVGVLRIRPLEGYLNYERFVLRRLGPAYEFIGRLGKRFERAATALSSLDQYYLSVQAKNLSARAVRLGQDGNSINNSIRQIQDWGEFALLVALVPYYVAHLALNIIQERFEPYVTTAIWGVFASLGFYRKFGLSKGFYCVALFSFLFLATNIVGWFPKGELLFRFADPRGESVVAVKEANEELKRELEAAKSELLELQNQARREQALFHDEEKHLQDEQLSLQRELVQQSRHARRGGNR